MKNALWSNIFTSWQVKESQTVLTLKHVPVFEGLTPKELGTLEKWLHKRTYQPGETVFKRHAPGEGMYIIQSGDVEIFIDGPDSDVKVLATLKEGEFFGELALLDREERSASARASTPSTLLVFAQPDLLSLIEQRPILGSKILKNLSRVIGARLRMTNDSLAKLQQELNATNE